MEHRLWTGLVITLVLGCAPPPSADRDRTGGAQDAGAPADQTPRWLAVSAGTNHSCGLTNTGAVKCWGGMLEGTRVQPWAIPVSGTFQQVASGWTTTCGLHDDGEIECWGDTRFAVFNPPRRGNFKSLSLSIGVGSQRGEAMFGCAVEQSGDAVCWGDNEALLVPPDDEFETVDSGWNHACGLTTTGAAKCWGTDVDDAEVAQRLVAPSGRFTQVTAGGHHSCGIRPTGQAECWGADRYGESTPPEWVVFESISASLVFTCGIEVDSKQLHCWGDERAYRGKPAGTFNAVSTGHVHSCAVVDLNAVGLGRTAERGEIFCWGTDAYGMLDVPEL